MKLEIELKTKTIEMKVNVNFTVLNIFQMLTDFTAFSFASMKHYFKDFVIMYLLLSLLFMRFREMQLTFVFVKKIKCFLLMFKINLDLNVNRVDVLCRALIIKDLKKMMFIFIFISL